MHPSTAIRAIALFEGFKGALVLTAGLGLVSLVHQDLEIVAGHAVSHLHLNPASRYPHIFLEAAAHTSNTRLLGLAAMAAGYSVFRLLEAYGLWFQKTWAEWVAAISGGIYIPFEVYEIARGKGWVAIAALIINVAIVGIMVWSLHRRGRAALKMNAGPRKPGDP
jgi:uncharacterized membrane protein (DUF2068 family)